MEAFATYQQSGQLDKKSAILSYLAINNATAYVSLMYLEPVDRPDVFAPFYNISGAMIVADTTAIRDSFSSVFSEDINRVVPRCVMCGLHPAFVLLTQTQVDVRSHDLLPRQQNI